MFGSYQDEQAVGREILMRRDGGEDGQDQAAENQDEPEENTGTERRDESGMKERQETENKQNSFHVWTNLFRDRTSVVFVRATVTTHNCCFFSL